MWVRTRRHGPVRYCMSLIIHEAIKLETDSGAIAWPASLTYRWLTQMPLSTWGIRHIVAGEPVVAEEVKLSRALSQDAATSNRPDIFGG